MLQTIIRPNEYQDSVALMLLSRRLTDLPGVTAVCVMMGTTANKDILRETGFGSPELDSARAGDLVLAVDADDADADGAVAERATELLAEQSTAASASGRVRVRSLARALDKQPASNLALVSVPGEHAAAVSHELLEAGLSVMIFSDNVGLADEVALKERAAELSLLVMGPDCGTSVLSGAALAFANVSRPGSIGIVGAAGTGIQEVASQIDRLGGGLSHAIGLGGRDLSADVGASSCLRAMALLEAGPATEVIVVVSRPWPPRSAPASRPTPRRSRPPSSPSSSARRPPRTPPAPGCATSPRWRTPPASPPSSRAVLPRRALAVLHREVVNGRGSEDLRAGCGLPHSHPDHGGPHDSR